MEKCVFYFNKFKSAKRQPQNDTHQHQIRQQIGSCNWKTLKVWKESWVSEIITITSEQPLQYWKMGLPFYDIPRCHTAPPTVRFIEISQKSTYLKNIKNLWKKITETLLTLRSYSSYSLNFCKEAKITNLQRPM